jgi:hypothetical protein
MQPILFLPATCLHNMLWKLLYRYVGLYGLLLLDWATPCQIPLGRLVFDSFFRDSIFQSIQRKWYQGSEVCWFLPVATVPNMLDLNINAVAKELIMFKEGK